MSPFRLFVTVGTDHHPFDRLVDWTDRWYADRPDGDDVLVQYGTSAAPSVVPGRELVTQQELAERLANADAVVCHGGPATIMEVRDAGLLPIVVPRDPDHGEHVDGHQLRFAAEMADRAVIELATDEDALLDALARAERDPDAFAVRTVDAGRPAVEAAARHLDALLVGARTGGKADGRG